MEYVQLGQSDIRVSEIILGCWVMGGDYWGGAEDAESIGAIRKAFENGVTTFDTAELYGYGRSEEIVGKALQGHRNETVLSSKVFRNHLKKQDVISACEQSLKRLKSDCIDIYFIHYPSDEVPIEETMEAMNLLKKQGKIRAIGLSNFSLEQTKKAAGLGRIDVIQPCYNLLWRYSDTDLIPYCRENGIGIIPYSPLAQGILTGKFNVKTTFPDDDGRKKAALFQPAWYQKALETTEKIKPIAEKYQKSLSQVCINWLSSLPGITAPIVGCRNKEQVAENLGSCGWKLSAEDWKQIDKISKCFTRQLPLFDSFFGSTTK